MACDFFHVAMFLLVLISLYLFLCLNVLQRFFSSSGSKTLNTTILNLSSQRWNAFVYIQAYILKSNKWDWVGWMDMRLGGKSLNSPLLWAPLCGANKSSGRFFRPWNQISCSLGGLPRKRRFLNLCIAKIGLALNIGIFKMYCPQGRIHSL